MAYKLLSDKNSCYFCSCINSTKTISKSYRNLIEVHHIQERNEGGLNHSTNLVPCCSNCHSKIHMNIIKIDRWYNVGYSYKLKWTDENGITKFGPYKD